MKKIILFTSLLFTVAVSYAQRLEQGKKELYYERYQSAENSFHTVLQQQPGNAEAWFCLTNAYLMQNKVDKAMDSLQIASSSIYREPYYQAALGYLLLSKGKKDSAALYFTYALKQTKEKDANILAAIARAQSDLKAGDPNYAIYLLNKAIKRDKHNATLYVLLGDAYHKLKNGSESYKAYKMALEKDQNQAAAYHKIGEIFQTQKNPKLYLDYFTKSITADAAYAPSLYKLYSYYFYHDAAKAMQYYNQYIANTDVTIQNRYDLADLFYLNKKYDEAIQKANRIVSTQGNATKPRIYNYWDIAMPD